MSRILNTSRTLLAVFALLLATVTWAQPNVQVGLYDAPGSTLEVSILPDAYFDQVVSQAVVTIRFATTAGVSLGSPTIAANWPLGPQLNLDQTVSSGGFTYVTYVYDNSSLFYLGASNAFQANTLKPFFTVPVTNASGSCVTFEVAYDTYQDVNNLLWSITLNGLGKQNGYIGGAVAVVGYPVLNQDTGEEFCTIQAAIDDAQTLAGHTIVINAGTYSERVVISKSLTLEGASETTTIIDGSGVAGTGSGVYLNNGITDVTIRDLTVRDFAGVSGNDTGGIYAVGGNSNLLVERVSIKDNVGSSGFYANGPIDNVVLDDLNVSGHTVGARGIVIWNGLKSNITVTNCEVYNNNCCGIELQDGSATGVTMTNNNVHDNGDNGFGLTGMQGPGENLIANNTVTDCGRFGIEVKNPNGSGATSGPGRVVVENNIVSRTVPIADARDIVGIAAFRRGVLGGNVDVPTGVVIRNNTVSGFVQTSTSDGFGIVAEGTNHSVTGNNVSGCDVGIQRQFGHLPYPGDGDQNNVADDYFGRGNSPVACGIDVSGNTLSNTLDTRDVPASIATQNGTVVNQTTNAIFCSLQAAIDAATAGDVLQVSAGSYPENIVVNKALTLNGPNAGVACGARLAEAVIDPASGLPINVTADGVTINGFEITAPTYQNAISASGRSNLNILFNNIHDIYTSGTTQNVHAVIYTCSTNANAVVIADNCVSIVGNAAIFKKSVGAITAGFSTDNGVVTGVQIVRNSITGVVTNDLDFSIQGRGAYGILVNVGAGSGTGSTPGVLIQDNEVSALHGHWAHAIGLEGNTPGAQVLNNAIDDITDTKTPSDAVGVMLESNSGVGSVVINENSFTNVSLGIKNVTATAPQSATCNWWGSASAATVLSMIEGPVVPNPFLVSGTDNSPNSGFQPVPASCTGLGPVVSSDPVASYFTIQAAIDASNAGATITVAAGNYPENVVLNKALTLNGPNAGIACGSRVAEAVIAPASGLPINVTVDGVTINGFEITAPSYQYAILCGGRSDLSIEYNNIHDINSAVSPVLTATHAIQYTVANSPSAATDVNVSDNCFTDIGGVNLTGNSASAIGFLQSTTTGTLTGLTIARNTITGVRVSSLQWSTGKIAYGIQLNAGGSGGGYLTTTGKIVDAAITDNEITDLSGHIATAIALEGNTQNAVVTGNKVSFLSGTKSSNLAGGGLDLNALKFESNRYVGTCTVTNNSFAVNTFTHTAGPGLGYGVANYVPAGQVALDVTTGAATLTCNWFGTAVASEILDDTSTLGKTLSKAGAVTLPTPFLTADTDVSGAIGFQPGGACNGVGPVATNSPAASFMTIGQAVQFSNPGATITVAAGSYPENVVLNKAVTLNGPNAGIACGARVAEAVINPASGLPINVTADGVTINGFEMTAPTYQYAISASGRSDLNILFNNIHDIYTSGTTQNVHAVIYTCSANANAVVIADNCISTVGNAAIFKKSVGAITAGFSTDNGVVTGLQILRNTITGVVTNDLDFAIQGRGAYGILVNVGAGSGTGSTPSVLIQDNEISALHGHWAHAIGLEGNTPGAQVLNNTIDDVTDTKIPSDAVGVMLESNTGVATVVINDNSFTNVSLGIKNVLATAPQSATCNWWGSAAAGVVASKIEGPADPNPYLVSGTDNSAAIGFQPAPLSCTGTPVVVSGVATGSTCAENADGSIDLTVTGGTSPYAFAWTGPTAIGNVEDPTGLLTGSYDVTVTDANSSTATLNLVVPVVDVTLPTITCLADQTVPTDAGMCTSTGNAFAPTFGDNCLGASIAYVLSGATTGSGSGNTASVLFNQGVTTVTYTVTDASSNTAMCSFNVEVVDNESPTVACPNDQTVNADLNMCSAALSSTLWPTVSDNCSPTFTTAYTLSGATTGSGNLMWPYNAPGNLAANTIVFNTGTTTVNYVIEDITGNQTTCSFLVTVNDAQAPTIGCPIDMVVSADAGVCNADLAWATIAPVIDEACAYTYTYALSGATTLAATSAPATSVVFNQGITNVTYVVTETNAPMASATCSFTVTVNDMEAPTFTAPTDITIFTDASCAYDASIGITGDVIDEADNCATGQATYTDVTVAGPCEGTHVITRTWALTDNAGNAAATQDQIITVNDNTAPTFTAPADITIYTDATCAYDASVGVAGDVTDEADNCSTGLNATFTDVTVAGPCEGTHVITRTWSLVDNCGNAAVTQDQIITVNDNTAPTFTAPANVTIYTDATCAYDASVGVTGDVTDEADNCSTGLNATYTDVTVAGPCEGTHVITRTWSLVDNCGNAAATQDQIITVNDNTAPTFTAPANITIYTDATCAYDASVGVTGDVTDEADNCSTGLNATFTDVTVAGPCEGTHVITRTWSLVDNCGNAAATQDQIITVNDNTAPTFAAPANITIYTDATCAYDASVGVTGDVIDEADNCSTGLNATFTDVTVAGPCEGTHVITRTWSLVDNCGNAAATQDQIITVNDNTAPTFTAPANITIYTDATCAYDASVGVTGDVTDEADNCSTGLNATYTDVTVAGPCEGTHVITRTWSLVDNCGNAAATQDQIITVNDNTAPMLVAGAIAPIYLTAAAAESAAISATTMSDNCTALGGLTVVASTVGTCSATVTVTVTDDCGNSSSVNYSTVIDNTAPVIVTCPTNKTANTIFNTCAANVTVGLPTATDNCAGSPIITYVVTGATTRSGSGDATGSFNGGVSTVTYTVSDGLNTTTCALTVTVTDNQTPIISCVLNQTMNTDPGQCYATRSYNPTGFSDNCALAAVPLSYSLAGATTTLGFVSGPLVNVNFNPGVTTVTYRVTDAVGLSSVCTFTVTVTDNQPPVVVCPAPVAVSTDPGVCTATLAYAALQPTVTSTSCDVFTYAAMDASMAPIASGTAPFTSITFPAGVNTLTYTLTESNAPFTVVSCSFTITVTDTEDPVITCPADIAQNTDAGMCNAVVSITAATATDNCSATVVGTRSDLALLTDPYPTGTTTITWVATDAAGNSVSCTQDVVITDAEAPAAVCQNITVYLDGSGNATITGNDIDGGSTDACGIAGLAATPSSFTCTNVGSNAVTLTVTDVNGNVSTCAAIVTVADTVSPAAVCQNITVYLDGSGNATITGNDIDGGSSDACGIASLAATPSSFTCTNVGSNAVTLTVTDVNGNVSTCSSIVTVVDTVSPAAVCQNITVYLDGSGNATITGNDIDGGSTDACGIAGLAATPSSFTCTNVGSNAVTLTVTDVNGNVSTCAAIVTVADTVSPAAVCQNITVYLDGSGNATITGNDIDGGSSDACGIASLAATPSSFTCTNVGSNAVTLTVTDVNGNVSTCSSIVTVVDTVSPAAVCQNITVYLDGSGNATITGNDIDGGSSDACGIASLAATPSSFTCTNVGSNAVTLTVTDVNGNVSTCSSIVTVVDTVSPAAVCQNITVYLDGSGNATITGNDIDGGSTDACGIAGLAATPSSFTCTNVGSNAVTLTVTDVNGNVSTCAAIVTVADTVSPAAVCQNITVYLDGSGNATITGNDIDGGSSDACGIASLAATPSSFTCTNVGSNAVTLTVTDVNGNVSTCSSIVTVVDTVSPAAVCQNITVYLDGSGNATITGNDIDGGSSDACGIASLAATPSSFTCTNVGSNAVTLTVTDNNGNISTCSSIVTVVDTVSPAAVCQNITVYLDGSGNATITGNDIDGGSSDACGIASLAATPSSFTCTNVGSNAVTLTVTDVNGNVSTCAAIVTVADTVSPAAVCQNITVYLDGSGNATITGNDIDGGSSDACGIASLAATPSSFTCTNVGSNAVTLTVTDVNGNVSTCAAIVTVADTVSPAAVCQNITVYLDGSGNATITGNDIDGGSSDACGIASLAATPSSFTCTNVGSNAVTLTVTDNNGNISTCSSIVTVVDTVSPAAVCQNITVYLDGSGNATITGNDIDGGSTDACGIAGLAATPSSFTCTNVGSNAVTLTVTDVNGNVSTCAAIVTVVDTVSPTAVCQNITVYLDGSGDATITGNDIDGGSSDACGIASLAATPSSFTCTNVGSNAVTLTVTDVNGNVSTCAAIVTVADTVSPAAVCQNITVYLDGSGNATITGNDIDGGSTDACGIAGLAATPSSFTCTNVGSNAVTLTVTDVNGNVSTCAAIVTVADTVSPAAVCQNITVYLDGSGNATITGNDIDGGSSDACGIASLAATPSSFTCTNVGANTVTLTVTDNNGNISTCSSIVTVVDTVSPAAVCQNITVYLDGSGNATITGNDIDGGSSDACGIASLAATPSSFTCTNVGSNAVTLTVTDVNGNVSTCAAIVTVADTVSPVFAACPANINQVNDLMNNCSGAIVTWTAPTAVDNCTAAPTVVASHNPGDFFPVGTTTVTYTATDASGNPTVCSFDVTVFTVDSDNDGTCDEYDLCPGGPEPNTPCDDGDPNTFNDAINFACVCQGIPFIDLELVGMLEGPYVVVNDMMKDDLRAKGLIPAAHPYGGAPFNHVGSESVSPAVLAVTGPDAIVDWVLVELRDSGSPNTVLSSRAALIQRDGDVVDLDGTSPVRFLHVLADNYYVALRHRNHHAAMTASVIPLSGTPTVVDLSVASTVAYGTNARKTVGMREVLWAGNAKVDNVLRYTGANNDRDPILVKIGGLVPTAVFFNTYDTTDTNMDGDVKYTGAANDREVILINLGGVVIGQRFQQLP